MSLYFKHGFRASQGSLKDLLIKLSMLCLVSPCSLILCYMHMLSLPEAALGGITSQHALQIKTKRMQHSFNKSFSRDVKALGKVSLHSNNDG